MKSFFASELIATYATTGKVLENAKFSQSADVAKYARAVFPSINYREYFYVFGLNKGNDILGWAMVSAGGVSATVVDPKIVFQSAMLANASGIIVCHNHPSGRVKPSEHDIKLTSKLVVGGKILDIIVLDHIIITSDSYYSFADEGLIN